MTTSKFLHRFTDLASTIHLLQSKSITLLNPATWNDRNDAYFMAEYKRYKNAKSVLALCFTEQTETYHHWRVFSHGSAGVRLTFRKTPLLSTFEGQTDIHQGPVKYKFIHEMSGKKKLKASDLPFLKRKPFEDECEFRIVFVSETRSAETISYPITISWLEKITLSPWLPKGLSKSVKKQLKSINGCSKLDIRRSTLVDNEAWKASASQAFT